MPKLPDASSLGERPVPRSERPVARFSRGVAGAEGAALAEAGEELSKTGARLQERQDRLESAYAESALLRGQLDALDELEKDSDYGTYEKRYTEKMAQIRQQASGMIRDSGSRALFEAEADTAIARGMAQVKDRARAKEKDFGRASQVDFVNQTVDAAIKAPDEATQARLLLSLNDSFHGMVDRGYMTAEEAAESRIATLAKYGVMKAETLPAKERVKVLSDDAPAGEGFDRAYQVLSKNEGGFTASDGASGSPAIYGINAKWHREAYAEAKRLTDEQGEAAGRSYAQQFYRREYWDKYGIGNLPPEAQTVVFDGVVNHTAAFSDKLVKAAKAGATPSELIAMRRAEYERLAKADPDSYADSLPGWRNRLQRVAAQGQGKSGDWTDFIPPDSRARLLEQAKSEASVEVRRDAGEIDSAARLGLTVPRERVEAVAAEAEQYDLKEVAADLRRFADVQDATAAFAKQGLADQEKQLKSLKASAEGGNLSDAPFYGAAQKVYENKLTMLKEEPWSYYQAHGVVQEHPPLEFGNPQAVAGQLASRRADAEAVRQIEGGRFSLPLLTKNEIEGLKQLNEAGNPQQAAAAVTSIGQSLNGEERQALARAIAPKDRMMAVALSVEPDKAVRLLSGTRAKGEVTDGKVREAANEKLSGVVFGPDQNEALHEAVYAYYKQLALEKGDTTKEVNPDLLDRAIEEVAGPRVEFSLGGFAPGSRVLSFRDDSGQWADEGRMEDIFSGLTDDLLTAVNGSLPYASDGDPVPAAEIRRRAQFVSAGDGVYVAVYPGLGVVSGRDGRAYLFDARKLEAAQKGAPRPPKEPGGFPGAKIGIAR